MNENICLKLSIIYLSSMLSQHLWINVLWYSVCRMSIICSDSILRWNSFSILSLCAIIASSWHYRSVWWLLIFI
jgi:hypothetical protein